MSERKNEMNCGNCSAFQPTEKSDPFTNSLFGQKGICKRFDHSSNIITPPLTTYSENTPQQIAESSRATSLLDPDIIKLTTGKCFSQRMPWQVTIVSKKQYSF